MQKRLTHFRNCKLYEAMNSEFRVRRARISVPSARSAGFSDEGVVVDAADFICENSFEY